MVTRLIQINPHARSAMGDVLGAPVALKRTLIPSPHESWNNPFALSMPVSAQLLTHV